MAAGEAPLQGLPAEATEVHSTVAGHRRRSALRRLGAAGAEAVAASGVSPVSSAAAAAAAFASSSFASSSSRAWARAPRQLRVESGAKHAAVSKAKPSSTSVAASVS